MRRECCLTTACSWPWLICPVRSSRGGPLSSLGKPRPACCLPVTTSAAADWNRIHPFQYWMGVHYLEQGRPRSAVRLAAGSCSQSSCPRPQTPSAACLPCRWQDLRDAAIAQQPASSAAAYRLVREMLARGLSNDPYSRWVRSGHRPGIVPSCHICRALSGLLVAAGLLHVGACKQGYSACAQHLGRVMRAYRRGNFVLQAPSGPRLGLQSVQQLASSLSLLHIIAI